MRCALGSGGKGVCQHSNISIYHSCGPRGFRFLLFGRSLFGRPFWVLGTPLAPLGPLRARLVAREVVPLGRRMGGGGEYFAPCAESRADVPLVYAAAAAAAAQQLAAPGTWKQRKETYASGPIKVPLGPLQGALHCFVFPHIKPLEGSSHWKGQNFDPSHRQGPVILLVLGRAVGPDDPEAQIKTWTPPTRQRTTPVFSLLNRKRLFAWPRWVQTIVVGA